MSSFDRPLARAPAVVLLLLFVGTPLAAQGVEGTLTVGGTGRPISGAAVTLEDAAGVQRAGAITDSTGTFLLLAPAPGSYRLHAWAPGYSEARTAPLEVAAGTRVRHPLALAPRLVQLDGLVVTGGGPRCVRRPENGETTERLWEQARTTLSTVALTEAVGVVTFRLRNHRRVLDVDGTPLRADTAVVEVTGTSPYRSLPADSLMRYGFVREDGDSVSYFAPDAAVLLSDAFLEGHCYSVRFGDARYPDQIGLAFEPVRARRRMRDVRGILWLDRRTGLLRSVEYEYTNLAVRLLHGPPFGGSLSFGRVGGAWVVRRWSIRMPEVGLRRYSSEVTRHVLVDVWEKGGEVLGVVGEPAAGPSAALVEGTLARPDGTPVPGATVYLSGTGYSAVTDSLGHFRLRAPPGAYELGAFHRGLAPGRALLDPFGLSLVAGRDTTLRLTALASALSSPAGMQRDSAARPGAAPSHPPPPGRSPPGPRTEPPRSPSRR